MFAVMQKEIQKVGRTANTNSNMKKAFKPIPSVNISASVVAENV